MALEGIASTIVGEVDQPNFPNITSLVGLERFTQAPLTRNLLRGMLANPAFDSELGDLSSISRDDLDIFLKTPARKRVEKNLRARATAQLKREGNTNPSDADVNERVNASFSGGLSIADLGELGIEKREAFKQTARKKLGDRRIFTGKKLKSGADIRVNLGIEQALDEAGNPVLDTQREALGLATPQQQRLSGDPVGRIFEDLLTSSTQLINEGTALLSGDFSGRAGQDVLHRFGNLFDEGFRGAGSARFGGRAALGRTLGAHLAGIDLGRELQQQGFSQLGLADPLSFPQAGIDLAQNARAQQLFNDQFSFGVRRQDAATRLAMDIAQQQRRMQGAKDSGTLTELNLLGLGGSGGGGGRLDNGGQQPNAASGRRR